jgi:2-keto-4-pentenoate hydratase
MRRQLELRRARIAAGDAALGWKLGFGTPAAMEGLGTDAPLVGFLLRGAALEPGAAVSIAGWTNPVVEPEIAVTMGRDLPLTSDRQTVSAAIAAIGPAIELADLSFAPDDVEAILAADVYQRHVLLGRQERARAGGLLDGLVGTVDRDGVRLATVDDLEAAPGDLLGNVMHVANLLAAVGETLRAGEIIITGSIVPPIRADGPTRVRYVLDPLGTVEVELVS